MQYKWTSIKLPTSGFLDDFSSQSWFPANVRFDPSANSNR